MITMPLFAHYLKALNPFWFAVRDSYRFLSSDKSIESYRLIWNLMQLVCWLAVWLTSFALKLGRGCRRYYEAEWSQVVSRGVIWVESKLDRFLEDFPRPSGAAPTETVVEVNDVDVDGGEKEVETPRFYVPHSLALRLTANDDPQAWRDLSPEDQETYLATVEHFVLTHQETPQEHWGIPDTRDDYQGQAVPNTPYKADYRYPRWAHNEALIAVDLVLAIAHS